MSDHYAVILEELKNDINDIKSRLDDIGQNTKRMDAHITFIESIYERLRMPIDYVCDKLSGMENTSMLPWCL